MSMVRQWVWGRVHQSSININTLPYSTQAAAHRRQHTRHQQYATASMSTGSDLTSSQPSLSFRFRGPGSVFGDGAPTTRERHFYCWCRIFSAISRQCGLSMSLWIRCYGRPSNLSPTATATGLKSTETSSCNSDDQS